MQASDNRYFDLRGRSFHYFVRPSSGRNTFQLTLCDHYNKIAKTVEISQGDDGKSPDFDYHARVLATEALTWTKW